MIRGKKDYSGEFLPVEQEIYTTCAFEGLPTRAFLACFNIKEILPGVFLVHSHTYWPHTPRIFVQVE